MPRQSMQRALCLTFGAALALSASAVSAQDMPQPPATPDAPAMPAAPTPPSAPTPPAPPVTPAPPAAPAQTVVDNTLPPPPPEAANKSYPACSRAVQDNCVNRAEAGRDAGAPVHPRHRYRRPHR